MSARALRKLTKKDDLEDLKRINKQLKEPDEEEVSEDDLEPAYVPNKFDLLLEGFKDNDSAEDDGKSEDDSKKETTTTISKSSKKKNKKKSKAKAEDTNVAAAASYKFVSSNVDEDEEAINSMIDENQKLNASASSQMLTITKKLFQIESKYLNSDNEMIRMFGAKIVHNEKNNNKNRNQRDSNKLGLVFKKNALVAKKPNWPEFRRYGLSMRLLKDENSSDDVTEFAFEHDKQYQNIQFMFLDAVETMDHMNIMNVMHMYPYHIDSLIQMSDTSRMSDDTNMAADLIERSLYALQNCFHPSFNVTFKSGASSSTSANINNIKFDYNRVENRCLFISLFKHLLYVGEKACYRTSLELAKLLLSLDIEGDPLGVILVIDFYAIRSTEYRYLIDFYELFNPFKHLDLLPNMVFSTSLAYFCLYNQTNDDTLLNKAEKLLQDALVRFPALLLDLLDKCGVMPDKEVDSKNKIFTRASNLNVPKGLKYLIDLYVTRMHFEWKIPENIQWLEKNVKIILDKQKSVESKVNEHKNKFKSLFSKVPTNLYRHLILSDIKEVAAHLPPEFSSTATYTFNPIPPKNSIVSYTRPTRLAATSSSDATSSTPAEALLTFFQSLLPSFNVEDVNNVQVAPRAQGMQRNRRNRNPDLEENQQNLGANNNNRFNMNQMAEQLRNFLRTMDDQFPAADPANENNNDLPDLEEFD